MHDIVFIEYLEGIDELLEDEECLFFGDDPFFAEHAFESAAVAVFVDEVEVVGCFEHVDVLDDVFIFFDVGEDVDLIDSTLFKFFVLLEASNLDNLHCIFFVI